MQAYYLDAPNAQLDCDALVAQNILTFTLPTRESEWNEPLQRIRDEMGYIEMDEVRLNRKTANGKAVLDTFFQEHLHTDEEIRFVTHGGGIFDIRDTHERWIHIHVSPGDLLIIPANRYHRFMLDELKHIVAKRLFKNKNGWVPILRHHNRDRETHLIS